MRFNIHRNYSPYRDLNVHSYFWFIYQNLPNFMTFRIILYIFMTGFLDSVHVFLIAEIIGPDYLCWIDKFPHRQNKNLLINGNTQILTRRLNGINECAINIVSNIRHLSLTVNNFASLKNIRQCVIGWSVHCCCLITVHAAVSIENQNWLFYLLFSLCSAY